MHVLERLAKIHVGLQIRADQVKNVLLKTLFLCAQWLAFVLMVSTLAIMASVSKSLESLNVLCTLIVVTQSNVIQDLALMLVVLSNVAQMQFARPETIRSLVLAHQVILGIQELHVTQRYQRPWMSSLAAALMTSARIMLLASTQHVATLVLCLILVHPMLSAKLFIILQSVLAQQATLEILKLSANYHLNQLPLVANLMMNAHWTRLVIILFVSTLAIVESMLNVTSSTTNHCVIVLQDTQETQRLSVKNWSVKLTQTAELTKYVTKTSASIPASWTILAQSMPFATQPTMLQDALVLQA